MSAGDRDTLASLLAEHTIEWDQGTGYDGCSCSWRREWPPVITSDEYENHLADVIADSDWLREQRAEAKAAAVRDAIGIIEVVGGHDEPNIEKETAASWLERFAGEIVSEATEDTE